MDRQASSQAAWALLTEGVTRARVEAHRLQHLSNRAIKLVEGSEQKEHLYQVAGDLIVAFPDRLEQLLTVLDRTSLALAKMGEDFLEARLSLSDRAMVDEAVESAFGHKPMLRSEVERVAARYLGGSETDEDDDADEVLTTRVDGKSVEDHIRAFLQTIIAEGQKVYKVVRDARKTVTEGRQSPISDRAMLKAVLKVVSDKWGQDPMTQPLAKVVALGEYVF